MDHIEFAQNIADTIAVFNILGHAPVLGQRGALRTVSCAKCNAYAVFLKDAKEHIHATAEQPCPA